MSGLFRRLLAHLAIPARKQAGVPLIGACAANCGRPVNLALPHHTVSQLVEVVTARGVTTSTDGAGLAHVHLGCWPVSREQMVTITAIPGVPGEATLVLDGAR